MSYQFPPYTSITPTGDGSSINSSLLTPPLTPHSEHDIPYRPTKEDRTSLNMRKRKHKSTKTKTSKHHKQRQSIVGNVSMEASASMPAELLADDFGRSRSLSIQPSTMVGKTFLASTDDAEKRSRRWTLPSKSASTRVFTPLRSTVKQATLSSEPESPAMSTLRRATTNKRPQRIELTFFPEPKFNKEKSNLLSYIVSTFSRLETSTTGEQTSGNSPGRSTITRSASIRSDGAHPASTFPAATVCTEAFVESNFAMPSPDMLKPTSRRCSTKYVTGGSNFEVIWDENDSSTTTQESSRPSVTSVRRVSLAAAKLEAQLASSLRSSRRPSNESRKSSSTNSQSSVNMFLEQVMTPEKLNSLFPRLARDSSLRNLPRSRGASREGNTVISTITGESDRRVMIGNNRRSSAQGFDVFPPLQCRRNSSIKDGARQKLVNAQQANCQPRRILSVSSGLSPWRPGGMIGCSSGARRRSSGICSKWQQDHGQRKRGSKVYDNVVEEQTGDTDIAPLLHKPVAH